MNATQISNALNILRSGDRTELGIGRMSAVLDIFGYWQEAQELSRSFDRYQFEREAYGRYTKADDYSTFPIIPDMPDDPERDMARERMIEQQDRYEAARRRALEIADLLEAK